MNRFTGVGRLTRDPEIRYSQTGTGVTNFTLAINRPFKDKDGNEQADFINCVAFGKRAETVANYVKKGHLFGIEGRVQTRNYENKKGQRVYVTEVVVDNFTFLQPKDSSNGGTQVSNQQVAQQFEPTNDGITIEDGDLPF